MRKGKMLSILIIAINIIGVICLIYFSVPYFTHDVTIENPDSMLPAEAWDNAGMTLTLGFFPLLTANVLGFLKVKHRLMRFLFFIPSLICFVIVAGYWITSLV